MVLADPTRRRIIELMADGEAWRVSDLATEFSTSRQAVTSHLNVLCQAGFVTAQRRGRERLNRLAPNAFDPLAAWVQGHDQFWDDRLMTLKNIVEEGRRQVSTIEKEVQIDATVETVWRYLEEPNLLAAWLMRNDFKSEADRSFHFFGPPSGTWDGEVRCKIISLEAPHKLTFTWNTNDIGTDTLVTIELSEKLGQTLVRLTHDNFAGADGDVGDIVKRHSSGWDDHLRILTIQAEEDHLGTRVAPGPIDWTSFKLYATVRVSPKKVIAAWITSSGMESFFVEMMQITDPEGSLRNPNTSAYAGDRFTWRWHNGRRISGVYLSVQDDGSVSFTFGESKVRIRVHPVGGSTLLELTQYDIPDTPEARMHVHTNCRAAWVYFLTNLRFVLERGIDGRDTTRETGASFSTYFDPEPADHNGAKPGFSTK